MKSWSLNIKQSKIRHEIPLKIVKKYVTLNDVGYEKN